MSDDALKIRPRLGVGMYLKIFANWWLPGLIITEPFTFDLNICIAHRKNEGLPSLLLARSLIDGKPDGQK